MKHIKNINENFNSNDLSVKICDKSKEIYEFISKYLHVMDFDSYINNENLYNVCVYDNNILIATDIFRMKDGKIHLNYSAVDEKYRNKGINKMMKYFIIDFAKKNNCTVITANVRESNIASINSFLSTGFTMNTKYDDLKYPDGEKKIPFFLYLDRFKEKIDKFKNFFK